MIGLVAANLGIAIIPDSTSIHNYNNIEIRPIHNPDYSRKIYLGYVKNRYMTKSVEKFKDYVIRTSDYQTPSLITN